MNHLVNTIKDRNEELYLIHYWPFQFFLAILIGTKNYGILETLTKIQFYHNILNLTNPKPWTNWQVFIFKKIELEYECDPNPQLSDSIPIFEFIWTPMFLFNLDPFFEPTSISVPINLKLNNLFWKVTFHWWEKNVNFNFLIWNQLLNQNWLLNLHLI